MKIDPIIATDFYKVHHKFQYPEGTSGIYSNFTPRSNRLAPSVQGKKIEKVVNFGIQGFIKWFLIDAFNEHFFSKSIEQIKQKYSRLCGVNTLHIEKLHKLGYLPIEIKALPEGELVPMKVPVFTVESTHPDFAWLVNYLETVLSNENWKSMTVATIAFSYRKLLNLYADITGSPKEFVYWQGHDFSLRGMSGIHDGGVAAGHMLSFTGTDTIPAIDYLENYYRGLETFVGASVPASEHSTASANILLREKQGMDKAEAERDFLKYYITQLYPSGVASYVSDTFHFFRVIDEIAPSLKTEIESRVPDQFGNAKVVFRPDSGDPVKIICGYNIANLDDPECEYKYMSHITKVNTIDYRALYDDDIDVVIEDGKYYLIDYDYTQDYHDSYLSGYSIVKELSRAEAEGAIRTLDRHFGHSLTSTGHKLLNPRVGLIYGDSITLERAEKILKKLEELGYASANVVFGIGSYTYQYMTRDTFGFAMKATAMTYNGETVELYKDPVTDSGTKKSAKGYLRVEKENGEYVLYDQQPKELASTGELRTVFLNGKLIVDDSLADIRNRLESHL